MTGRSDRGSVKSHGDARLKNGDFPLSAESEELIWVRASDWLIHANPGCDPGEKCHSPWESPASLIDRAHPDDRERVRQAYEQERRHGAPFNMIYRITGTDGTWRWIHARSFRLGDAEDKWRTVGIAEDITSRREIEELLRIQRDLAISLGSVVELHEALNIILEACLSVNGVDGGGIYLIEPDTGTLQLFCHAGLSPEFIAVVTHYTPDSPQARLVSRGEPNYWTSPPGTLQVDALRKEGIKALASIPVKADGHIIAALNIASRSNTEIPRAWRAFYESLAIQIAATISRLRTREQLQTQSGDLLEANSALKALLRQRESDRLELEESILENVRQLILPHIEKLKKSSLPEHQKLSLDILEANLQEITSPFIRKTTTRFLGLTSTEIRVADLIRKGRSSKEIADILGISERAVTFHRQSIRGKLGLKRAKVNLHAYLSAMSD